MNERYKIVSSETLEGLVWIVNQCIDIGWRALGGPFVVDKVAWSERPDGEDGQLVAQALVKDKEMLRQRPML